MGRTAVQRCGTGTPHVRMERKTGRCGGTDGNPARYPVIKDK